MFRKSLLSVACTMTVCAPTAAGAITIYGLTAANQGNTLITFDSATPGTFTSIIDITGLQPTVSLFALDLRPATGTLYALGRNGGPGEDWYGLFQIGFDGAAVLVGDIGFNLGVENVGFDFNPQIDRIRVVTGAEENYVVNPNDASTTMATDLFYPDDDPNRNPAVESIAYSNNVAGAGSTQLYALDRNGELLATLANSAGTLQAVGNLFEDNSRLNGNAGFDIAFDGQAFFSSGVVRDVFYSVDLTSGSATEIGGLERRLTAITAGPGGSPVPEPETWIMLISGFGLVGAIARRRNPAALTA